MRDELYERFGGDRQHIMMAVFSSIFIMQNRLQTACERIQTQISMKQWLLLAMAASCPEPRTLTRLGELMGCSRQNVKKLAATLETGGYVRLERGDGNSVCVELTEKADEYAAEMAERHAETMRLLFLDFSDVELEQLFSLYSKLYAGIDRVERYAAETEKQKKNNDMGD